MAKGDIEPTTTAEFGRTRVQRGQRASHTSETQAIGRRTATDRGVGHIVKKLDGTIVGRSIYRRGHDKNPPRG